MDSIFIKRDNWLSKIINKPAYILNPTTAFFAAIHKNGSVEKEWLNTIQNAPSFAFCKVQPTETKLISGLEKIGFHLVDTNVGMKSNSPQKGISSKYEFCHAQSKDKQATMDVALKSFIYSRFHQDYQFPNDLADKIKAEWVGNFFEGERGTHMIVAKDNGVVIGFMQIIANENNYLVDLIAVVETHRKQGVAENLIRFATESLSEIQSIQVGTQISNIPSINLYEKMGFRFDSAKYVFHYNQQ